MSVWLLRLMVLVFCCSARSSAWAHGIAIWAEVVDDWVEVSAYDSQGGQVRQGHVIVKDLQQNVLIEGQINADGYFVFKPEMKTDMLIVLTTEDAVHHDEFWISVDDFLPDRW